MLLKISWMEILFSKQKDFKGTVLWKEGTFHNKSRIKGFLGRYFCDSKYDCCLFAKTAWFQNKQDMKTGFSKGSSLQFLKFFLEHFNHQFLKFIKWDSWNIQTHFFFFSKHSMLIFTPSKSFLHCKTAYFRDEETSTYILTCPEKLSITQKTRTIESISRPMITMDQNHATRDKQLI